MGTTQIRTLKAGENKDIRDWRFTFVEPVEAPTTAMISDAFPRITVGFEWISSIHFSVRNVVAPTPTGSRIQGFCSSFARATATCMKHISPGKKTHPSDWLQETYILIQM